MVVDVSGIGYFGPIFAFLIVFIVMFAILNKTKILGEALFVQLFISFLIASIFVSTVGVRRYVLTIVPWFAVLILSLFFVLLIINFVGKPVEGMIKIFGILFLILAVITFLISAFVVFSDVLVPFLPGGAAYQNSDYKNVFEAIIYSRVTGALFLLILSGLVSWVLVKGK